MTEWLDMGGYGAYVWSSYALALVVLAGNGVWPYLRLYWLRRSVRREADE